MAVDLLYAAIDPRVRGRHDGGEAWCCGSALRWWRCWRWRRCWRPGSRPYGPNAQDILARLQAPDGGHWLGTDNFGRDVLARVLFGLRTLFAVSALSVLGALAAGGSLGVLAAWRGGLVDRVAMRLADVLFAFPIILLAIGIIAMLGPGALQRGGGDRRGLHADLRPHPARPGAAAARGAITSRPRARSARATPRILLRHLLPNLASVILVQASLSLSTAILVEASLSFLGLGTQPPTPSLGRMLAESRNFLQLVAVAGGVLRCWRSCWRRWGSTCWATGWRNGWTRG